MHATLPKALRADEIKKRIEDMDVDEEGSAMPYAMAADSDDHLWLDPGALVTLNKSGNFVVKRTARGYEVVVSTDVSYRWEHGEIENRQWDRRHIPVAKIHVMDHNCNHRLSGEQAQDLMKLSGFKE
jgi:hypothetical protein